MLPINVISPLARPITGPGVFVFSRQRSIFIAS